MSKWKKGLDTNWYNHLAEVILMGFVHYCAIWQVGLFDAASPVSAWEWEPGGRSASSDPDAGQPDLTRPVAAPVSSQAAVTGCHSSVHIAIVMRHMGVWKKIHPLRERLDSWISKEYNIFYVFISIDLSWKYGDCDIILKCFLAKIAGTEMTEHPCLYLWWDSSGSVSTLH